MFSKFLSEAKNPYSKGVTSSFYKKIFLFLGNFSRHDLIEIYNKTHHIFIIFSGELAYVPELTIVYRPGYFTMHPPPPAPSGPKFSNSENCCGSENAMPPKIFWDMEGHRGHFRSKNVFFFQKTYFGKNS